MTDWADEKALKLLSDDIGPLLHNQYVDALAQALRDAYALGTERRKFSVGVIVNQEFDDQRCPVCLEWLNGGSIEIHNKMKHQPVSVHE